MLTRQTIFLINLILVAHIAGFSISEWQKESFDDEAKSWKTNFTMSNKTTYLCTNETLGISQSLLGGYKIVSPWSSMSRTYTNVPSHDFLYVIFHLWRLDSWDALDFIRIKIDNTTFDLKNIGSWTDSQARFICASKGYREMGLLQIIITLPHNSSDLNFTFINGCDQSSEDESSAIRELSVIFKKIQPSDSAKFNLIGPTSTAQKALVLNCSAGFYQMNASNNSCMPCHPSCKLCSNGTSSDCLICNPGFFYQNGSCNPCDSSCRTCSSPSKNTCTSCYGNKFLHADGICRINCTLQQIYGPPFRCNCSSTDYIYLNGLCWAGCKAGFQSELNGFKYCNKTCPAGYFLYVNGSCSSNCLRPFFSQTLAGNLTCTSLCPANSFYFQNGSCSLECPFPYIKRNLSYIEAYCDLPCSGDKFFYLNLSCLDSCDYPFTLADYKFYNICEFACSNSNFFYSNGSCLPNCPTGFLSSNISIYKYCSFRCSPDEYQFPDYNCSSVCQSPHYKVEVSLIENYCLPPCSSDKFYYLNQSCLNTCTLPYIVLNYTYYSLCAIACANRSQYLYENATCRSECNPPFLKSNTTLGFICNFPCLSTEMYSYNQECESTCLAPYKVDRRSSIEGYCLKPCKNNEYYYLNGSCLANCPYGFLIKNNTYYLSCEFPCFSGMFLYQNYSCLSSCDYPFVNFDISIGHLCNFACDFGYYYHQNSTCLPHCDKPFEKSMQEVESYCTFPCDISTYLYSNGSCFSNCTFPFYSQDYMIGQTCNFPCRQNDYFHSKLLKCVSSCNFPDFTRIDGISAYCHTPVASEQIKAAAKAAETAVQATAGSTSSLMVVGVDPSTAAALISILQSFFYLLFFNVVFPKNVESILGSFNIVNLNFLPNPLYYLYDEIPDVKSPPRFYDNGYTGLFIESAGRQVLLILFFFSVGFVSLIFGYFIRSGNIIHKLFGFIFRKIKLSLGVRIIVIVYMDILMCCMLSILSENSGKRMIVFSRIVSYIFFFLALIFPFIMLHYLRKPNNSLVKLKRIEPLIEDYDIHDKDRKIFGFYILTKREIHSIVIVGLYYVPLFQTLIPVLLNLVLIVLYIKLKPHHRMALNVYETLYEVGYFILHICVLCLAYMDTKGMQNLETRDFIGWLMIGTILLNIVLSLVQIWAENITAIKGILLKLRRKKSSKLIFKQNKGDYKKEIKRIIFPKKRFSFNFDDLI